MAKQSEGYIVEIDRVSQPDWHRYLQDFADASIYQTWSYGAARWSERNLSHLVLRAGSEILGLGQLRIVRAPVLGSGVAYLRWGPLYHHRKRGPDEIVFRQLISALQNYYVKTKGFALRILPNAFAGTTRAQLSEAVLNELGFKAVKDDSTYRTIVMDLSPTLEDMRRALEQKWRNQLNQSERNNLIVSEGTGDELWKAFETLYYEMMARKRFETSVSIKEFADIQQALPENLKMRLFIAKSEGKPVAGIACSFVGDAGAYLLGATNEKALKLRAANLLQWEAIKAMKQRGLRCYDLGGIDPKANPGGFHFKRGTSGREAWQLPAFDLYRSLGQRLMLKATFKAAGAQRVWKIWRHKNEFRAE